MANPTTPSSCCRSLLLCLVFLIAGNAASEKISGGGGKEPTSKYIIHVRVPEKPSIRNAATGSSGSRGNDALYHSMLASSISNKDGEGSDTMATSDNADVRSAARSRMVYTYNEVFTGFTARLTGEELKVMSRKDWFVDAVPDRKHKPQTTHSGEFLGLRPGRGLWNLSNQGQGVIIAVLDTGIFPNHPSFSGEGMPPPPAKWKGSCEFGPPYCNNKLIGARSVVEEEDEDEDDVPRDPVEYDDYGYGRRYNETSAIDEDGHGTHTASTAAGAFVENASAPYGLGKGSASGMAPRAHIAMYKLGANMFRESALLKGIDEAVADGVDIISLSVSASRYDSWDRDMVAIATFSASAKGVFVSTVAGNGGPDDGSVMNEAPWVLTVGASSTDRRMRATVRLGNGEVLEGGSLYQPTDLIIADLKSRLLPLGFPANRSVVDLTTSCESTYQLREQIEDLRGRIVVCLEDSVSPDPMLPLERSEIVQSIGAAGMIYVQSSIINTTIFSNEFVFPATCITYASYERILAYSNSTDRPTATIEFHGAEIGAPNSPSVAELSSRGPSRMRTGILKPDIVGPGLGILAAGLGRNAYAIMDGTSMSCPHLSGIAALIKSAHPSWSPAMIKSAIMTTADVVDGSGTPITDDKDALPASFYAMGAGNVNPENAGDPGLVYDSPADEYVPYFCGLGYTDRQVQAITGKQEARCAAGRSIPASDLNHPSISVNLPISNMSGGSVLLRRTVTNVGLRGSIYRAEVISPPGVKVTVAPENLAFGEVNEKKSFRVSLQGKGSGHAEGYLKWVSATHVVRSPISVTFA